MDRANESFAIAEEAQTKYCIRQGASCDQPSGKVKIDAAYVAVNTPIVREQLQKSGVRLAHLLDAGDAGVVWGRLNGGTNADGGVRVHQGGSERRPDPWIEV
jgi:hypothetical protein